jgi:hypothetical protein
LASPAHHALIDDLTQTTEWNFLSSFSMHGDHDLPPMPLLMFAVIDAAALFYEPFSKRAAFHYSTSIGSSTRPGPVHAITAWSSRRSCAGQLGKNCADLYACPLICINGTDSECWQDLGSQLAVGLRHLYQSPLFCPPSKQQGRRNVLLWSDPQCEGKRRRDDKVTEPE